MKAFTSLDEIKAVSEKFEAGKIVPKRILKGGRYENKMSHMVKWSRDVYRLQGKGGSNVFMVDFSEDGPDHFIVITGCHKNLSFNGNPYGDGGNFFLGNFDGDIQRQIDSINRHVFGLQVFNKEPTSEA